MPTPKKTTKKVAKKAPVKSGIPNDVFRQEQRELTIEEKAMVRTIKKLAQDLHDAYDFLPISQGRGMAQTYLTTSVMWATRQITE